MHDRELCEFIGHRIKQRRTELHLGQQYLAEKMDVNKSTIQRYEAGTIDNSKKLILEGLSEALHVSSEWLRGETEEYESDVTDKRELQIGDAMTDILQEIHMIHSDMKDDELAFSKDFLLLLLREYMNFVENFKIANEKYGKTSGKEEIAKAAGFDSETELNEMLYIRQIMQTIDSFHEIRDILRKYPQNPKEACLRMRQLLRESLQNG